MCIRVMDNIGFELQSVGHRLWILHDVICVFGILGPKEVEMLLNHV